MKKNSLQNFGKNALGTMFLLMGAFLVCSTFLSMRVVLADPIGPALGNNENAADGLTLGRQSPRNQSGRNVRATAARPTTGAAVTTTKTATRNVVQRPTTDIARGATARGVVSRELARRSSRGTTNATRTVRPRTATTTNTARVSLSGDAIRGTKTVSGTYYTYLNSKLYTGNYSNIVDSSTGLISADAYSNCLESYYTCMDEICTARNEAQRRCACAGRVKAFAEAEDALNSANEELIKISGQLALLIANKGKEVSAAFELTDAERVMNCVSWREASENGTSNTNFGDWCAEHGIYDSAKCAFNQKPEYCDSTKNSYGFDVDDLDGAGSDILASLSAWADEVKNNTDTILADNTGLLDAAYTNTTNILNGIYGSLNSYVSGETTDSLAETWGYDLFRYAHNNVCARVLDSCFNGIYEGCGTPPSGGRCANGATSSCPFNYNSKVTISSSGDVTLNERSNIGTAANASCFGYSSSSDPYENLRGPVADARRSVMQKYLLDANADCDLYGEQLKTAAQKITYQKVAAQQALQQKRLEFYNEERNQVLADATAAGTNFDECISELLDCYDAQLSNTTSTGAVWTAARIQTYCAQIANVPHCYQNMICNPSAAQFRAIIDTEDSTSCRWHSSDYTKNDCRNVVTLYEILNNTGTAAADSVPANGSTGDSAALREMCLSQSGVDVIRTWKTNVYDPYLCGRQTGMKWTGSTCELEEKLNCEAQGKTWSEGVCKTQSQINCENQGGVWNTTAGTCKTQAQINCENQGGTWANGSCRTN